MRVRRGLTRAASCAVLVIGVLAGWFGTAGAAASAAAVGAEGTGVVAALVPARPPALAGHQIHQTSTGHRTGAGAPPSSSVSAATVPTVPTATVPTATVPTVRLRQQGTASADSPVRYLIEVHNPGSDSLTSVGVYQLLSPVHGEPAADPEPAATSARQLRWTVSLAPGETARFRTRAAVSSEANSPLNLVGLGDRPRLGTTACVAPDPDAAVSGCDTVRAEAVLVVPWWRSWYALAAYALIAILSVAAGIVWSRRRESPDGRNPARVLGRFLTSRA